jgi:hypothetical protein
MEDGSSVGCRRGCRRRALARAVVTTSASLRRAVRVVRKDGPLELLRTYSLQIKAGGLLILNAAYLVGVAVLFNIGPSAHQTSRQVVPVDFWYTFGHFLILTVGIGVLVVFWYVAIRRVDVWRPISLMLIVAVVGSLIIAGMTTHSAEQTNKTCRTYGVDSYECLHAQGGA